jgi:hypothetical protein
MHQYLFQHFFPNNVIQNNVHVPRADAKIYFFPKWLPLMVAMRELRPRRRQCAPRQPQYRQLVLQHQHKLAQPLPQRPSVAERKRDPKPRSLVLLRL